VGWAEGKVKGIAHGIHGKKAEKGLKGKIKSNIFAFGVKARAKGLRAKNKKERAKGLFPPLKKGG